jgi:hypothetical protein
MKLADIPAQARLGVRAETVRRAWPVAPVLVVVPDEASYVRAVGGWTLKARYPVLIDDGTLTAQEDIARFIRGFRPERVVAWSARGDAGAAGADGAAQIQDASALPQDAAARRELIEAAVRRVWTEQGTGRATITATELIGLWVKGGIYPPGLVVADEADPAWTAALALAAGRAQPLVWVKTEQGVNGEFTLEKFGALAAAVEDAAEKTGLGWREIGDPIDAVTLCLNAPAKVQVEPGSVLATTDLMGRRADGDQKGHPREHGARWAWAGQIFGTSERAAYGAMCALFLVTRSAWIFDSYQDAKPWDLYDGTAAGEVVRQAKLEATVIDKPKGTEREWRMRAGAGIEAGLVLVNSHGMSDEFGLDGGSGRPGDVPFLRVPAAVHFVHSWSLALPGERATVGGRWIERGAYAYAGAVQEPFLAGFVPTPVVAARLMAPMAWGVAVRVDGWKAWKIAVVGDPLMTVGPAPASAEGGTALPLAGTREMEDVARELLGKKDYGGAVRVYTMLGRDADAARLGAAVLRDEPKAVTAAVARGLVMPLARARDIPSLVRAYGMLPGAMASEGVLRDALWHACYPELGTTSDQAMVAVLRGNLREDQVGRDAADLAGALGRLFGREAAFAMLAEAKDKSRNESDRKKVEEAVKRLTVTRMVEPK